MLHTEILKSATSPDEHGINGKNGKSLLVRATGRFYTPLPVAWELARVMLAQADFSALHEVRLIDPFCGDGQMLTEFIELAHRLDTKDNIPWNAAFSD
jgi:hypothetical protein